MTSGHTNVRPYNAYRHQQNILIPFGLFTLAVKCLIQESFSPLTAATSQESCNRRMPSWLRTLLAFSRCSLLISTATYHIHESLLPHVRLYYFKLFLLCHCINAGGLLSNLRITAWLRPLPPTSDRTTAILFGAALRAYLGTAFRPFPTTFVPQFRFVYNPAFNLADDYLDNEKAWRWYPWKEMNWESGWENLL